MSIQYEIDRIVSDDLLKSELRVRNKKYYETSIPQKKLPIFEKDGWYLVRTYERSKTCRIRLDKKSHELIEDEVWTLFANLGFIELNKGREFKITLDSNTRKIDIFAKDDETVIITECTQSENPGTKKSLIPLIDKIKSYREDIVRVIKEHYGRSFMPKFGWVIATRNIIWSKTDLERAENADIVVLRDEEIDYFIELQKLLKTAARYQFLAMLFSGKSIRELQLKVPATRGNMGGVTFYTFLISPEKLLKIAYIGHKNSRGPEALDTYQRIVKPKRLKEIAAYINSGGKFPTNIVINLQSNNKLNFNRKDEIGDLVFGELTLPNSYASAWIIDGQHRLYGYSFSERASDSIVPVLAFSNLDSNAQKHMFVDINHKQVKVPQGLLLDIYSELHWGSDIPEEALTSLCSKITKVLGGDSNSPLNNRIIYAEKKKTHYTCLTIATIASALKKEQLVGTVNQKQNIINTGPLGDPNLKKALSRSKEFLFQIFSKFKDALPKQWELGDAKGGYICTNNSIAAILKVLKAIFDVLERIDHVDIQSQSVNDLVDETNRYLIHLIDWIKTLDEGKFSSLRSKVGSKGQIAVAWEMQQAIYERDNNFRPKGLIEWMESFDREGTREAKKLVDEIQLSINNFSLTKLKELYGDDWWYEGIPNNVRTKCATRKEEELGKLEIHQYLDLIDYKTIAIHSSNWSNVFQKCFTLDQEHGDRHKKLKWIVDLNTIRKTISHPERGMLIKEEVEFVKTTHRKLKEKIKEFWIE